MRRWFWGSLGFSLLLFITAAGCVVVDARGRAMAFGDRRPALAVERSPGGEAALEVRLFGREGSWDVTPAAAVWDAVWEFCCLP